MPSNGFIPSHKMFSVRAAPLLLWLVAAAPVGDPAAGRAIVADRTRGLCLLCHAAPIAEERLQGDIAPSLAGVGNRFSPAELRQRLVNPASVNPDTVMPAYFVADPAPHVAPAWRGRTILTAQEIEDVVAYLSTLRTP